MIELLVLGALGLAAAVFFGLLFSVGALVLWVITLPFRLLGLIFQGIGVLLALPFMLIFGILGAVIFGVGFLIFLTPAVPLILLAWLVWWLVHRPRRAGATSSPA